MRLFRAAPVRHSGTRAPGPTGFRVEPMRVDEDGYSDFPVAFKVPVGRRMVPSGYAYVETGSDDVGRFPMAPALLQLQNPRMPGNPPDGLFPDATLGWSLYRLEVHRNLPGTWVIPRDKWYSRQSPILRKAAVARNYGPIAPNITGGESVLTKGLFGLGCWWCV